MVAWFEFEFDIRKGCIQDMNAFRAHAFRKRDSYALER